MSVCTFSIASVNAFSKVCSSILSMGHEILLNVGGVVFHLLYDKGAAANCLNLATFNWCFSNTKQLNHATGVRGAGCNDLGLYGVYALPVKYKKKTVIGKFMVSESLDVDLFGIDVIKELVISHDAKSQQVFSIVSMPGVLVNT